MVKFQNLEIIGWFIWWTIRDVLVSREEFWAMLQSVGIEYPARQPKPSTAYLKAIARVQAEGRKDGLLIRPIKKRGEEYVHGLVDEKVHSNEHLDYRHECNLRFFKDGTMVCDNPNHEAYKLVLQYYDLYMRSMDSDDVREVIKSVLSDVYSLSVRNRGGIYFIPAKFSDVVEKLETVIDGLGTECYMATAPQIDEERTKKSIYKAFLEGLKERIMEFRQHLESNLAEAGVDKDNRHYNSVMSRKQTALTTRLEEYRTLKKEIEFYADALDFQATNLREELEGLGDQLQRKLSEDK